MSYRSFDTILADPLFFSAVAKASVALQDQMDVEEACATLVQAGRLFGADAAAFATFVRDDEAFDSYRAVLACDPLWCDEYERMAGYTDDPWLEHARHSDEARLTQNLVGKTSRQRAVAALARRFGFESGIVIPLHGPQGLTRLGALCIGSTRDSHFHARVLQGAAYAAAGLATRLYQWQLAQLRHELLVHSQLTDEDVSLLGYERAGRTSKEVAKLVGLTPPSVNSRWQRLNAKLGVSSRAQAARLAAEYGVI